MCAISTIRDETEGVVTADDTLGGEWIDLVSTLVPLVLVDRQVAAPYVLVKQGDKLKRW